MDIAAIAEAEQAATVHTVDSVLIVDIAGIAELVGGLAEAVKTGQVVIVVIVA